MLTYIQAKADPNGIRSLTSLSQTEFEQLVPPFEAAFELWMQQWTITGHLRERHKHRSEDPDSVLSSPEDRLLFILIYLRNLPTQDSHSRLFGLPQPTVRLWIRTLLPIFRETLLWLRDSPFQAHNQLCQRLTLNPVLATLLYASNEAQDSTKMGRPTLFTVESTSSHSAPYIHVNRKVAQSLVLRGLPETNKINLNVGEVFSGAGGFGLGFILANHPHIRYRPLFAFDNDQVALQTYQQNTAWLAQHAPDVLDHEPRAFLRNARKLRIPAVLRWAKLRPGDLDLLIGGPPCQGFSSSNKTNKVEYKHANNALVNVFLDMVSEFRPKMFLMENVQGVRWTAPSEDMTILESSDGTSTAQRFKTVREFLRAKARSLGYLIWDDIIDAADFGVPQHRLRFFLFGIRCDLLAPGLQEISLDPYLQRCRSTGHVSVEQAIGDLPPLENGQVWDGDHYEPDVSTYVNTMRRFLANGDLFDHYTTLHQLYVIDRFRQIPEGGNWEAIREQMTTYNNDTIDNTHRNIYRRLRYNMPANTISHYRKSMVIHPLQDRGLSFREACRLQSFPDWFRFAGTRGKQQQQLANAVPPLMATSVAYAIAELFIDEMNRKRLTERLSAVAV